MISHMVATNCHWGELLLALGSRDCNLWWSDLHKWWTLFSQEGSYACREHFTLQKLPWYLLLSRGSGLWSKVQKGGECWSVEKLAVQAWCPNPAWRWSSSCQNQPETLAQRKQVSHGMANHQDKRQRCYHLHWVTGYSSSAQAASWTEGSSSCRWHLPALITSSKTGWSVKQLPKLSTL